MDILHILESVAAILSHTFRDCGLVVSFSKSPENVLNPSCSLNLRRGPTELDLLVWNSGEAEISIMKNGNIEHEHIESVFSSDKLSKVTVSIIEFLRNGAM